MIFASGPRRTERDWTDHAACFGVVHATFSGALNALLKSMRSRAHTPRRAHNQRFARSVPPVGIVKQTPTAEGEARQIGGAAVPP
jgi:hypothetical protein